MKNMFAAFALVAFALPLASLADAQAVAGFNRNWRFTRDGGDEQLVDLPHDGGIFSDFNPKKWDSGCGALPYSGHGEYRKSFDLPDDGRVWRLEFDGVMSHAKVFVNGKLAAVRPFGYASFTVPLAGFAHPGANELLVTVDAPKHSSRWYPGFGIYRDVRLVGASVDHVVPGSVAFITRSLTDTNAVVEARWEMSVSGCQSRIINVADPKPWSPESPTLYLADLGGEKFRYGIRTLRFDKAEGFFLNGVHRQIRGVCIHHDLGVFGAAFVPEVMRRNLLKLKEMGCDAIRTSHNPPGPALLELCDELGFMVMVESFDEWRRGKVSNGMSKDWDAWHVRELTDLVRYARRHPSVVIWSVGNELAEDMKKPSEGIAIARELSAIVHANDPENRPTTAGHYVGGTMGNGIGAATDLFGANYLPAHYGKLKGKQPIVATETCSTVSSRGVYALEAGKRDAVFGQVPSYDLCVAHGNDCIPDVEFAAQEANPHVIGEFVWTGFDYLGEPDPWRGKARSSYFGIFDLAGFPKDRYWAYRSQWRADEPVAHIFPHWNWNEGDRPTVMAYSNGDTAELFVNGVSQGVRKRGEGGYSHRFTWTNVVWKAGVASVKVTKGGKAWASDEIRTSGKFDHFEFSDESCGRYIFRTAKAVDAKGVFVPTSGDEVEYAIPDGYAVLGTCNGDAMDLRSLRSPAVRAFSGLALIVFERKAE